MSISNDKFIQLHKALRAMSDVILELNSTYTSEATQNLELEMFKLDELMKPVEITVEMVIYLRQLTGEGMMSCNKALRHCNGDIEKAVDYLKRSGTLCI